MENSVFDKIMMAISKFFKYLWFCFPVIFMTSCTVSVIMNHTEGTAADMVDQQQAASPDISPTVSLPMNPV